MEGFSLSMESVLSEAVRMGASDTHITVGLPPMIRIDGTLMPLGNQPLTAADTEYLCKSMINKSRQQYLNERGEIDFSYVVEDYSRFRCNIYKQRGTYALAARSISNSIPTCEQLGLPDIFKDFVMKPRGLILVTGPTGSGKSTTLAAMIGHVNGNKKCHVLTLEEPIEYLHDHGEAMINQREIHEDTLSFANALRAALREDPDIILVGEMRDLDTISTAITAAETGHLVLSTLHTSSAADTVNRIIDVFPPHQQDQVRVQLSTVLVAVICQTLVPRIGGGRCAAFEIMIANDAVRNNIREGKTYQIDSTLATSLQQGMCPLDFYLAELIKRGIISRDTGLQRCRIPDDLKRYINNVGGATNSPLFNDLDFA